MPYTGLLALLNTPPPGGGGVVAGTVSSTLQLYPPTVFPVGVSAIVTPVLGSTVQLFPPRAFPPFLTNTRKIGLKIEVGLGTTYAGKPGQSLRRTLLNQQNVVGCWFHSELINEFGSRDFSANGNHGTYEGTNYVRGLSVTDLPEGGIATHFDGSQQVRVPNDGLTGGLNLSLAGGSFDIYVYFRTTTNDTNLRGVVTKFDPGTNSGWIVQMQSGTMNCQLYVGGTLIFSLNSDFIADGQWHRVGFCYEPEINLVTAWRDGVLKSTATGTVEPVPNAGDVIVAGWGFLTSSSTRFVGDLYAVMIGREGNSALPSIAEACTVWTDISQYAKNVEVELGDQNQIPFGTTASTGRASFKLENYNPLGRFSPGHDNQLFPGFRLSRPVRIRMDDGLTLRPLFRGFISDVTPQTGEKDERTVAVNCVDWMEVLAVSNIGAIDVLVNRTSSYCMQRLLGLMVWPPVALAIGQGDEVFPFAFDQLDENTRALQEVADITRCEGGATFIRRDGMFVYQARQARQLPTSVIASLNGNFQTAETRQGLDHIINIQRATVYPREAGTDTDTILTGVVSTDAEKKRQQLIPDTVIRLEGHYSDPEQRSSSVGGTNIQTLVPGVDYTMTANEDGSGDDLTAYLEFLSGNPPQSGGSYSMEVRNNHPFMDGWLHWQIRGRILRRYDPVTVMVADPDSVNEHLPREGSALNMKYLSKVENGRARAQFLVNLFKDPVTRAHEIGALIDLRDPVLNSYLTFEVGSPINITEPMSAITAGLYWVQGLRYSFSEYNILRMNVTVVPAAPTSALFIVGDGTYGVVGTAVVGY